MGLMLGECISTAPTESHLWMTAFGLKAQQLHMPRSLDLNPLQSLCYGIFEPCRTEKGRQTPQTGS